ncbi:hypothetical protein DFS34DRAFT_506846 [Phlyctochytrium arcticum]|nr:hypothetical protein DFS34DRAFT_506846 [Phlyctochytrium arcticum]
MWLFNSSKGGSQQPQRDKSDGAALSPSVNFSEGDDDTHSIGSLDLNDNDLDDPQLLEELQKLSLGVGGSIDEISDSGDLPSDDSLDETSRTDWPNLDNLSPELAEITDVPDVVTPNETSTPPIPVVPHTKKGDIVKEELKEGDTPASPSRLPADDTLPLAIKLKSSDPVLLQKYLRLEKIKAVQLSRAGDKAGALEALRGAKEVSARIEEVCKAIDARAEPPKYSDDNILNELNGNRGNRQPSEEAGLKVIGNSPSLVQMNDLQLDYKKWALASKKADKIDQAREALRIAKLIQKEIENLEHAGTVSTGFHLPPTPSVWAANWKSTSDVKTEGKNRTTANSDSHQLRRKPGQDLGQFADILEGKLVAQMDNSKSLAVKFMQGQDNKIAAQFAKIRKDTQNNLEALRAARTKESFREPTVQMSCLKYQTGRSFPDISLDTMEVRIQKATNLQIKGVSLDDINTLVAYEFPWQNSAADPAPSVKGETSVVKGTNSPEYNHVRTIKITRNRAFQRFLEKKKAVIEVFQTQRTFLLLEKRVPLAKCYIKLDPLLTKCEITGSFDLMDCNNPRKPAGGQIDATVRLMQPFSKPEIVSEDFNWIIVVLPDRSATSAGPVSPSHLIVPKSQVSSDALTPRSQSPVSPAATKSISPVSSTTSQTERLSPVTASPTVSEQPAASPSRPIGTTSKDNSSAALELDDEDVENQFLSPEAIISNMVLEKEHEEIQKQMAALKVSNKPVPEDLLDRSRAYEVRMSLLIGMVQTGQLSIEAYTANIHKSLQETKKLALHFKKNGKMPLAKQALMRIKYMSSELEELEEG